MRGPTDETQPEGNSSLAKRKEARSALSRELEQAILRVVLVGLASAYLILSATGQTRLQPLLYGVGGAIWLGAIALLLLTWFSKRSSAMRRVFAIAYDAAAISVGMYLTGPTGAPLYPLYLWIALGNGFRFGVGYLYLATSLGLFGFSLVVLTTPFWLNHVSLSVGLVVGLGVLPIYVAKLLQRQHRQWEEDAQRHASKGTLLSNVVQELRTPLNDITGMSDLIRETTLNRSQREFADAIGKSAVSMASLLENVADYAKLENGSLQIVHTDFDLHNVLNGTVRTLRAHGSKNELRIHLHVEPEVPFSLQGDPQRLRQILSNMIVDVVRQARFGRIEMRVSPIQVSEHAVRLLFEIQGWSTGPEVMSYRRGHGYQTHSEAPEAAYDRNSLALATAKALIRALGGELQQADTGPEESTVTFELPFDRQPGYQESTQSLQSTRLLLISDTNSPHLNILKEWLQNWSVRYEVVETASAAFVRAESEIKRGKPFHVILVDKPLIDIDARQFVRAMRKVSPSHSTALLLIARGGKTSQDAALQAAGYTCLLPTPLNQRLVFNALHSAPVPDGASRASVVPLQACIDRGIESAKTRILVAEDNPTNQKFLARILNRAGYDVDVVHNGEEALDALEVGEYQLVIVDMHMPVMDGIQTAKLYRFIHPTRPRVPFIMLTASTTTDAKLECEAAGIETFLTKPIEASRLVDAVGELLSQHVLGHKERPSRRPHDRPMTMELPDTQPVLNLASLQEVQNLGYGTDFFHELVQGFIRDGNGVLEKMDDALDREDYSDFRDAGQALKGNAGSIGAVKLYKCCSQIERMSRADYELMGQQLRNDIRSEFRRACSALIEYSKQLGNNIRN